MARQMVPRNLLRGTIKLGFYIKQQREGKMAAVNRAMRQVSTSYTIFSDANTMLDKNSVKWMIVSLLNPKTGCVAGEKRILNQTKDSASGAGEGIYWNYESLIKKLESKVGSTIGAAGELFGIRTELYEAPAKDTIIDDFVISLKVALKGFYIKYQHKAIATEHASLSINEEKKRKIRIAAGGFQVLFRMPQLLNVFKHGLLSFQYFSHKVLRWLVVPFSIPLLAFLNIFLVYQQPSVLIYLVALLLQMLFYFFAIIGFLVQKSKLRAKILFVPYYILMMNYTTLLGLVRYIKGQQSAAWEKAERSK
jgi:cellulose synthase/poly-beta-1,6-N-acetylglucosamine synthase-like glycosyltransferase